MKNNYFIHGDEVWIELNRLKEKRTLFTIIDLDDLPLMDQISGKIHAAWKEDNKSYYARYGCTNSTKQLHQFLMGFPANKTVDHLNHDTLNNKTKSNLRIASRHQQKANPKIKTGSSKYLGVTWDKVRHKWVAQAMVNYKHIFFGRYETEIEAAQIRDQKITALLEPGTYVLNFPIEH